jgi:hypothetical protein
MRFRIFWVDDTQSWVRSIKDQVEEVFTSHDFLPEIHCFEDAEDARSPILSAYADLILVDCNLPNNLRGEDFIKSLRLNRCFAHVLFYSQDAANLAALVSDKHFLHISPRESIFGTLTEIADQAFRKYRHPAFMRGLLLSEFIDLENLMEDLIVQCFNPNGDYFRETILNKGGESFSFSTKMKFISSLIKNAAIDTVPATRQALDSINFTANGFTSNVIEKRNILAHAYPVYDDTSGKISLVSPKMNIDFGSDWFLETREGIHNYKKKIRDIISLNLKTIVNP